MPSTDPEHIAISKSKGIKIDWKDGHTSSYSLTYLREQLPMRHLHRRSRHAAHDQACAAPFPMYKPTLKMVDVESVGNYAIRIVWSDGHSTGIYSFEHFRHICPCEQCAAQKGSAA